jgi:hypothetical protein
MSHKKTPYHVGPYYKSDVESSEGRVCECGVLRGTQAVEDAAFITIACNCHYDLLNTLRDARKELRLIYDKDCDAVYDPTLRIRMDSIIAKAEEK